MSKVREVKFRPDVNDSLVTALRDLLSMAEAGELVTGYFAGYSKDGCVHSHYSASEDRFKDIAAIHRMLHRLNIAMDT